ncbi:helix-turn-helix domain-containing protein [Diaminobutyricibacter sp. McL0608]|uniref:helix-turn-helix domain-containing protein n=1 Tax=Leifsonia sp. McL0608 TaxID=3143537 RepID=UPI0031F32B66
MMQRRLRWFRGWSAPAIGRAIQDLRIARDWNQEELAERVDSSRATISRMERGGSVANTLVVRVLDELGYELVIIPKGVVVRLEEADK